MRTFKTFNDTNKVTQYFLQLCYNCDDKHLCTTEEECKQCWTNHHQVDVDNEHNETRDMLAAYYA
ncbi:hypothetical protein MH117_18200 [Paenibacillus sp. ACRRX]|uniref:hypothetical protein n=1 Tax=unclassified Paenibacillus TaxID=185978 RepID=UPI001EF409D9|nr:MULTISPECIES: hypothetical protein [unclassified Paenibacillus]MCG7409353.1 hypothetical protein [Paenibacillus sp. ACRRX]MDK8180012.1 hypothetical protein [Paenibacillus sp. UMB4589-SE434]